MKTRMVPVEHIFNRFPRMVRDLAKSQGKDIDFTIEGKRSSSTERSWTSWAIR